MLAALLLPVGGFSYTSICNGKFAQAMKRIAERIGKLVGRGAEVGRKERNTKRKKERKGILHCEAMCPALPEGSTLNVEQQAFSSLGWLWTEIRFCPNMSSSFLLLRRLCSLASGS